MAFILGFVKRIYEFYLIIGSPEPPTDHSSVNLYIDDDDNLCSIDSDGNKKVELYSNI